MTSNIYSVQHIMHINGKQSTEFLACKNLFLCTS
jgi:hypothetical protein